MFHRVHCLKSPVIYIIIKTRRKCHMTATKAPGATPTPILTTSGPQSTTKAPGATPTPTPTPTTSGPPPQAKGLLLEYNKTTKFIKKVYVCIQETQHILHSVLFMTSSSSFLPPPSSSLLK